MITKRDDILSAIKAYMSQINGYVYSPLRQPTCRRQTDRQTDKLRTEITEEKTERKNSYKRDIAIGLQATLPINGVSGAARIL